MADDLRRHRRSWKLRLRPADRHMIKDCLSRSPRLVGRSRQPHGHGGRQKRSRPARQCPCRAVRGGKCRHLRSRTLKPQPERRGAGHLKCCRGAAGSVPVLERKLMGGRHSEKDILRIRAQAAAHHNPGFGPLVRVGNGNNAGRQGHVAGGRLKNKAEGIRRVLNVASGGSAGKRAAVRRSLSAHRVGVSDSRALPGGGKRLGRSARQHQRAKKTGRAEKTSRAGEILPFLRKVSAEIFQELVHAWIIPNRISLRSFDRRNGG